MRRTPAPHSVSQHRRNRVRERNSIVVDGRSYRVQRRERLRGRLFLLLELLAPIPHERWLAFNTVGGQLCTLLVLPNDDATPRRIGVLRRLESNSLPKILDYEKDECQTRIVMPWIKGITVKEYLQRIKRGVVAPPEPFHAVRLALELARGLNKLHRHAQVIHGDIKPANLVLTHKPSHLSMIDFGSAWPTSKLGFRADCDGTTDAYAAPELHAEGVVNDRADQFSAMVVLYQLLTGDLPYEGLGGKAGWPEFSDASALAKPPSHGRLSKTFLPRKRWREIDALVLKGINIDPQKRFAHSFAWVDAVEDVFLSLRVHRSNARKHPHSLWGQLADFVMNQFVTTNSEESK